MEIGPNLTTVLIAMVALVPAIIAAYYARQAAAKTTEVGHRIDGRLDALLVAARNEGVAAGVTQAGGTMADQAAANMGAQEGKTG